MHYTFYGTKKYIQWEFRFADMFKDSDWYFILMDGNKQRVRSHTSKKESFVVFEETTDFDYTSVEKVEYRDKTYNIGSIVKQASENEVKVFIDYIENIDIGFNEAVKEEEEYNKKEKEKEEKREEIEEISEEPCNHVTEEVDTRGWFRRLFRRR